MFSYQKTLVFTDIQTDKSGRYVCSGVNIAGGKNTTDRLLSVKGESEEQTQAGVGQTLESVVLIRAH